MSGPLTKVMIIYILGVTIGYFGLLPLPILVLTGLSSLVPGLLSLRISQENGRVYFYLLVFALGALNYQWHIIAGSGNVEGLAGNPVIITGTICQEPDVRPNYVNYVVKIEKAELAEKSTDVVPDKPIGKILLTVNGPEAGYAYGDRLEVKTTPMIPQEPGQPGQFDYRKYLKTQGVQLTAKAWQGTGIRKIGTGGVNFFVDACILLKGKLLSVTGNTLPPRYAGLLQGVLFGSSGLIDSQIKNDFAAVGVVHILSVSGYHVTLVVAICLFLTEGFKLNRRAGMVFTVTVTLSYVVMSGAGPAGVRALIMGCTMLLARYLKRDYDWVSSMSLSALIILLINPNQLFQAGFQLSFAATWGVLGLTPQINKLGRFFLTPAGNNTGSGLPRITSHYIKKQGLYRWLGNAVGITLGAQLAVFPVTSYYFNYFSLLAVPANLIIVPLTTLVVMLGGFASIVGLIWLPLAGAINVSTGFITELIIRTAHWLAGLPMAVIVVKQPAVYEIAGFYLCLFFVINALNNPAISLRIKRTYLTNYSRLLPIALIVVACLLWTSILSPGIKGLELTFLDIGQGDGAVIESPGGFTAVIDIGGAQEMSESSYNPGEKILMPFLRRKGISRIDVLLLSHPHADHIQGARFLVNNIPVKMLIIDRQFLADNDGARLVEEFRAKDTKIREVSGGDMIWFDEKTKLEVISPWQTVATDANDDSLMVKLCYGEFHALFTGDAGADVLQKLDKTKLHSEVVKVPHHGSKNSWSESFYQAVSPKAAVISVGANNFGHPSGQVLRGLKQLGIACYRTDVSGAVIINSNGSHFEIRTGRTLLK